MTYANEVSVTYNPYRLFTKEEINRDQFLPSSSEEHYNNTGKNDTLKIIEGLKKG